MAEKNIKKRHIEPQPISNDKISKIMKSVNAVDIITVERPIKPPTARKLNSKLYVDTETGEIKSYRGKQSSLRNIGSMAKTFKRLRELIRHNFIGDKTEIFLTLTFRDFVDNDTLNKSFENFWNRLTRFLNGVEMRCIAVIEPLGVKRYHFHCLVKRLDGKKLFIRQSDLLKIWGNGGVYIKKIWNPKGLGIYLNSLYVRKKQSKINFLPPKLQIYRRRGRFEKIDKFELAHGKALEMLEKEKYILDEIESYILIDENENVTYNGVTNEYWIRKQDS